MLAAKDVNSLPASTLDPFAFFSLLGSQSGLFQRLIDIIFFSLKIQNCTEHKMKTSYQGLQAYKVQQYLPSYLFF